MEMYYCRDCLEVIGERSKSKCPECKGENLLDVKSFFDSIIERLQNSWIQMLVAYDQVSALARKGEVVTRRYNTFRKKGLKGGGKIRSEILNFYASLSLLETISSEIQETQKDFKQFTEDVSSSLPPSAIIEKMSQFRSHLLEKITSIKEKLNEKVSSLNPPRKDILDNLQKFERKTHLLYFFKTHRNLHKRERIIQIICGRKRRRFLYVTSQRLLIISALKNKVIKEISLSKISSVELKGRIFTKKIALRLSNQRQINLQFHPGLLSKIRANIKEAKEAKEDNTFTLERNMYKPDVRRLLSTIITLFKSILRWIKRERTLIEGKHREFTEKRSTKEDEEQDEEKEKEKEREILERSLSALEDSFRKGLVKPDYFFEKKSKIERDLNNLKKQ